MLLVPVVLDNIANLPIATLACPVVLSLKANAPKEALSIPVVLLLNAQKPTAVLFEAVLQYKAFLPKAVLLPPTKLHIKA